MDILSIEKGYGRIGKLVVNQNPLSPDKTDQIAPVRYWIRAGIKLSVHVIRIADSRYLVGYIFIDQMYKFHNAICNRP